MQRRVQIALAVLLVVFAGVIAWQVQHVHEPDRLSVVFIGLWNNPANEPRGFRIQPGGGVGLCAVFGVTNIGKDASIWFDTPSVEQKTKTGWQRIVPDPKSWQGIESDDMNRFWPPGFGCFYVLEWPPCIPTNASWRLRVRYGQAPSPIVQKMADKLGADFLVRRGGKQTIVTSEVGE